MKAQFVQVVLGAIQPDIFLSPRLKFGACLICFRGSTIN